MRNDVKRVCIVGLGRVGLTLAITLANVGLQVLGVERERSIVARLKEGKPHFFEEGLEALLGKQLKRNLDIKDQLPQDAYDAYVICVATPVDRESKEVILEPLRRASQEVASQLVDDALVVVRSTVPIGATRDIVLPLLRESGRNLQLAFCPERTVEGRALIELRECPQIIGGMDEESVERAVQLFSRVTATTVRVSSLEAAETIKLLDNAYRDLNFAFSNEIALMAEGLGLDGTELVKWANLGYPRNNIPSPGLVGGTCLTKDPYILVHSAASVGFEIKLARQARAVNEFMPYHIFDKLGRCLAQVGKKMDKSKILIAGVAFKGRPDTDDLKDSPAITLARYMQNEGHCPKIYAHDFVVVPDQIREENLEPCGLEEGFRDADAVVFMNNHPGYHKLNIQSLASLMRRPAVIIDGWHILDPKDMRDLDRIVYGGLGVG